MEKSLLNLSSSSIGTNLSQLVTGNTIEIDTITNNSVQGSLQGDLVFTYLNNLNLIGNATHGTGVSFDFSGVTNTSIGVLTITTQNLKTGGSPIALPNNTSAVINT